ncbi:PTS IIA-like nitrogen-regulatory protein PtsN [Solimonas aquatica]|uniref:PTS IIA-like nitrogen-regulatory protein PtsN n=1 Tax=Solimonas aquatica TaxID=489703 RepID=A0A1H9IVS3_9GAMM|nr:PTS sugar transporter subunit IIA [Solimonas aquatica]SEQ78684.1 PTS IIA-like nitrogen-regulatory protein PtsN [Solimonas aquatica]
MKIAEILSADRVSSGPSFTSKKKALEELAQLLAKGASNLSPSDVLTSLSAREKLGSTGLGHGVAIPHGRIAGVENSIGAIMRLKHPLDYDAHDGHPVDLIFGLLVPHGATEAHLKHLAAIAEMFSDEVFCKKARAASDSQALYQLIADYNPA